MGFPGYFLIVADFINWAKNNGVPVGPGRGSGAGSLVAYSLGITDLDPLRLRAAVRALPESGTGVDARLRRRLLPGQPLAVIEYVRQKYGADAVSQIATFGTMASRAVIRDVGRVLDMPLQLLRPAVQADPGRCRTSRCRWPRRANRRRNWPSANRTRRRSANCFDLAEPLEGLTRNVGMHAGGVLIAPGKLTDFCPLYRQDGDGAVVQPVRQGRRREAIGLVKFDFLGLRNLTIIELAVDYVER
jgi:DNA polymerase-3 subunit alpha